MKELNDAVEDCAKFTASNAAETTVRHVGETVGKGVATAGVGMAVLATAGKVECLIETAEKLGKSTEKAGGELGKNAKEVGDGVLSSAPVVGHIKGGIHYAVGDKEGGDNCMRAASRTTAVVAGGVAGTFAGGPAGAIAGGVAAGAACDGAMTGIESAINGEYKPQGQIAAWDAAVNGKSR